MNDARMEQRSGGAGRGQRPAWCAHPRGEGGRDARLWPREDAQRLSEPAWRPDVGTPAAQKKRR